MVEMEKLVLGLGECFARMQKTRHARAELSDRC